MTAYLSRLFQWPGPSAGIRKRPRSRYEPEPETYLSRDSSEIDWESTDEEFPGDRTPTSHGYRRQAAGPAAIPEVSSKFEAMQTFPGPAGPKAAFAAERTTRRAPWDRYDADQHPNRGNPPDPLPVEAVFRSESADAAPSPSDTAEPHAIPHGDPHPDYVAAPARSEFAPAAGEEAGRQRPTRAPHEKPQTGLQPTPAALEPGLRAAPRPESKPYAPLARSATAPIQPATPTHADLSIAHRPSTLEPMRASRQPRPNAKPPDPAVRQTIANVIAEPVRERNTEVVVNIDRIEVRASSSTQTAPPETRRARAAPTSLESYLRSRSRRGGR